MCCHCTAADAQLTTPLAPRDELGLPWGFHVRLAAGLSQAVKQAPFEGGGGYDLVVGEPPTHALADENGQLRWQEADICDPI